MTITRSTPEQRSRRRKRAAEAEATTWVVLARLDGETSSQGSYGDPNEAHAVARDLRRTDHLDAWVVAA